MFSGGSQSPYELGFAPVSQAAISRPPLTVTLTSTLPDSGGSPGMNPRPSATHRILPFTDVPPTHWAASAVAGLAKRHILGGTGHQQFTGDRPVTRYELALALYRMVCYLEPPRTGTADESRQPAHWLVTNSYLPGDTLLAQTPVTTPVSPSLLSESLAYVTDRVLLHRATPEELKEQNQ